MKWIKATEKLPTHYLKFPLKYNGSYYTGYYDYSRKMFFLAVDQPIPNIGGIEWLDETESESPELQELQAKAAAYDLLENLLTRNRSIELTEYRGECGEVFDYGVITDTKEFLAPTLSEAIEKASKNAIK